MMTFPINPIASYHDFMSVSAQVLADGNAFVILKQAVDEALTIIRTTDGDITALNFSITDDPPVIKALMTLALPFAMEHDAEAALIANIFDLVYYEEDGRFGLDFSLNFVDGCLIQWV